MCNFFTFAEVKDLPTSSTVEKGVGVMLCESHWMAGLHRITVKL